MRCFGAQVYGVCTVFGNTLECLEHQIELPYAGKFAFAAYGAGYLVVDYVFFKLLVGPARDALLDALALHIIFDEIVRAVTGFAALAVHKGIAESAEVTACDPDVGVHQNSAVETRVERVFLDKLFPPRALDVVFELNSERAVVPGVCESAVYFAARKYETSVFAEGDKFVHCQFCHILKLLAAEFSA